jgi:hypothetical protein
VGERVVATRVCAEPAVIDGLAGEVIRLAPDEALAFDPVGDLADPHAIVFRDAGWWAIRTDEAGAAAIAERHCAWPLPRERPAAARGGIAGLPGTIWLAGDGTALILVPAPYGAELEERLR